MAQFVAPTDFSRGTLGAQGEAGRILEGGKALEDQCATVPIACRPLETVCRSRRPCDMSRCPRSRDSWNADYQRACALIHARCGEYDFELATVATDLGCSTRQAQRVFAYFDTSFQVVLTDARMQRGVHELLNKGTSVRRAADMAGFRHPRHFSTSFRNYYGLPPVKVRNAGKVARRLRRRAASRAPSLTSPASRKHFKVWRADHRRLVVLLRGRRPGTALDQLFADVLRLRGPDLRTTEGRHEAQMLRSSAHTGAPPNDRPTSLENFRVRRSSPPIQAEKARGRADPRSQRDSGSRENAEGSGPWGGPLRTAQSR